MLKKINKKKKKTKKLALLRIVKNDLLSTLIFGSELLNFFFLVTNP